MTEQKKAKRKLTVKQKILIKSLVEGKSLRESSKIAGLNECYACYILKQPKIKEAFTECLERAGLTDQAIADKILALINAKKTMFFSHQGKVVDRREVEALDIQADITKFVTKIKGHVIDRSQVETPGIEEILRQIADKRQQQLKHD
jgi:hypothetical protein